MWLQMRRICTGAIPQASGPHWRVVACCLRAVHARRWDNSASTLEKSSTPRADPVGALLHYLDAHPADLVVHATHQRTGIAHRLHRAVAEPVARYAEAMTLFL